MGVDYELLRVTFVNNRWDRQLSDPDSRPDDERPYPPLVGIQLPHVEWAVVRIVKEVIATWRNTCFIGDFFAGARYTKDWAARQSYDKSNFEQELTLDELMVMRDACDDVIQASRLIENDSADAGDHPRYLKVIEDDKVARMLLPIRNDRKWDYNEDYLAEVIRTRDAIDMIAKESRRYKLEERSADEKYSVHYEFIAH